ncbi:hypothetical protein PA25_10790 [Pseudoalteromonas sp. A25]|uniref:hypothetical protein n=1 Tax=Pseudoalteromonas sp. A25 TaxID=116092 RepID=UPI001260FF4C|nr:hypothetical protein [Pseudoalteromonas sp. A25]BBN81094.1 hypothetical protein PA25_10790 [Pseudoalteromonas sp. A25]
MTQIQQLNQLMSDSVQDAITYIENVSEQKVELNVEGLKQLDLTLDELAKEHQQSALDNKTLFTVSTMFGAFIGELFKGQRGGEWFLDDSDPAAPFIVLNYAGKSYPFASVCFEKIVNNADISVCKYFELALENKSK